MQPNRTNNFFGVKVSKTGIPVQNASDKQLVYKDDFSTKTYYDLTNSRMLEGLLPDGSYGLWVSVPGVDVDTANPNIPGQLAFNSSNQTFQILDDGTTSIPSRVVGVSSLVLDNVTVPHTLGFVPIVQAYISAAVAINNVSAVQTYMPLPIYSSLLLSDVPSPVITFNLWATADAQNIYFSYLYGTNASGAAVVPAFPVQYYLVNVSPA